MPDMSKSAAADGLSRGARIAGASWPALPAS